MALLVKFCAIKLLLLWRNKFVASVFRFEGFNDSRIQKRIVIEIGVEIEKKTL